MSKTLVLGASPDNSRYSYKCVKSLLRHDHEVVAVGTKKGRIQDIKIQPGKPEIPDIHTVSIYLNAKNQPEYYEYILGLNPKRIIFNPGAYNKEFIDLAKEKGIKTVVDCTLVMLSAGTF